MDAKRRREALLSMLVDSSGALTGADLAAQLGVSRQVVVQDIALLRAQGSQIIATPGGYACAQPLGNTVVFACRHTGDEPMREELYAMVDNGGKALDVIVEHGVYGQITAMLNISSRYEVDQFIRLLRQTKAEPLSVLTGGVHLHTVAVPDTDAAGRIRKALQGLGVLVEEDQDAQQD